MSAFPVLMSVTSSLCTLCTHCNVLVLGIQLHPQIRELPREHKPIGLQMVFIYAKVTLWFPAQCQEVWRSQLASLGISWDAVEASCCIRCFPQGLDFSRGRKLREDPIYSFHSAVSLCRQVIKLDLPQVFMKCVESVAQNGNDAQTAHFVSLTWTCPCILMTPQPNFLHVISLVTSSFQMLCLINSVLREGILKSL